MGNILTFTSVCRLTGCCYGNKVLQYCSFSHFCKKAVCHGNANYWPKDCFFKYNLDSEYQIRYFECICTCKKNIKKLSWIVGIKFLKNQLHDMTMTSHNHSWTSQNVHIHPNIVCAKYHFIYPHIKDFTEDGEKFVHLPVILRST